MLRTARERGLAGLLEWLEFCAEHGLDGVEVGEDWLHHLNWAEVVTFVDRIRAIPLEVSGLTVHNHMNCPPGESRENARRQIRKYASMAQLLGAPTIRIESGAWGDFERYRMSRHQAIDNTVETIEFCLPIAEESGITLAIENHPGWVTRFADALVEILERVASDCLALNLDTGSLYREGQRPQDFLAHGIVAKRTISLHVKSIRFEPNPEVGWWNQSVPFDESDIDYRYIFSSLREHHFDGWMSYESDESVGLAGLAAGADFARRLWREVEAEERGP
jgi:sugar phosphate isomerase/epimerase